MTGSSDSTYYGWSLTAFDEDEHVIISSYFLILVLLLLVCLIAQHIFSAIWKGSLIPTAGIIILIGMVVSGIIRLAGGYSRAPSTSNHFDAELLGFSPSIFYFGFLPLIIFESGYHLKRQLFFTNFFPIVMLALVGTCVSIIVFSTGLRLASRYEVLGFKTPLTYIESVCFGALISSTDPVSTLAVFSSLHVDPQLYYLVFGESVLNDAIAITVFTVTSKYVTALPSSVSTESPPIVLDCAVRSVISFVISCLLGYGSGIVCALFFKYFPSRNQSGVLVVTVFMCMVYLPFFLSECLQLSGIVTVLFAGVSIRRYVNKNISLSNKLVSSFVLKSFVNVAEVSCFGLLGMSVFSQSLHNFLPTFVCWSLMLILLGRALHVYPILLLVRTCFNVL